MTAPKRRTPRQALLASVSVLLCLVAVAFVGAALHRSHPPSPGEAETTGPPAAEHPTSDPGLAALQAASLVATATDAGRPIPEVPRCEAALQRPTAGRCTTYENALRDLLEDARRPCVVPGHARAEDLSCVPLSYFDHRRV